MLDPCRTMFVNACRLYLLSKPLLKPVVQYNTGHSKGPDKVSRVAFKNYQEIDVDFWRLPQEGCWPPSRGMPKHEESIHKVWYQINPHHEITAGKLPSVGYRRGTEAI